MVYKLATLLSLLDSQPVERYDIEVRQIKMKFYCYCRTDWAIDSGYVTKCACCNFVPKLNIHHSHLQGGFDPEEQEWAKPRTKYSRLSSYLHFQSQM